MCDSITVPDDVILPACVNQIVVLNREQRVGGARGGVGPVRGGRGGGGLGGLAGEEVRERGLRTGGSGPHASWEREKQGDTAGVY